MCIRFLRLLFALSLLLGAPVVVQSAPAHPFDLEALCPDSPHLTSASNRLFFGRYVAAGGTSAQDHLVVITDLVAGGYRLLFYVWGAQPLWGIESPGCIPVTAQESGRVLSFIHVDRTVHYTVLAPDRLRAVYRWGSGEMSGFLGLVDP